MEKDSFVFRKDWYIALKNLNDVARLEVYDAIMREVFEDGNKDLSPEANIAMMFISPLIKRDIEKYNLVCERRKLAGSQGGIAKASKSKQMVANGSKRWQKVASVADNVYVLQDTDVSMCNNNDSPKKKKTSFNPPYPDDFESDWKLYGRKGTKKDSYEQWKKLSDEDKVKMRRHIPHYLQSNDIQFLKDFERYIKHRVFESPVYRQSNMLFDPQMVENHQNGEYDPSEWLNYDENFDAFRYFGREPKYDLRDGYTDDNRPDGARVVTQATVYVWSASSKKWSVTK